MLARRGSRRWFGQALVTGLLHVAGCSRDAPATRGEAAHSEPRIARAHRLAAGELQPAHESERARPGDVVLDNGLVRFVITGDGNDDGYVGRAGRVIDAELVRPATESAYDGVDEIVPQVNGCPIDAFEVTIARDGSSGGGAEVVVQGSEVLIPEVLSLRGSQPHAHGLELELRYSLADDARELRIESRVRNPTAEPVPAQLGDFVLFGSDEAQAFTLPGGFDLDSDLRAPLALGSAHHTLPWAALISAEDGPLRLIDGSSVAQMVGEGDAGLWQYTLTDEVLAPDDAASAVRYLALGEDVAQAGTPQLQRSGAALRSVRGNVVSNSRPLGGARVSFFDGTGAFVTQALSDAAGQFAAEVPDGSYRVVASGHGNGEHVIVPGRPRRLAEGHPAADPVSLEVGGDDDATLSLELAPAAEVMLRVRDGLGLPIAARIAFLPDAAPEIMLAAGERVPLPGSGISDLFWALDGNVVARVRPGTYSIVASHGPRASIDARAGVVLAAGVNPALELRVERVVPALGFIALDSHQHAMDSQHGEATRAERVITNLSEGLDVVVSSDHDRIVDYAALIDSLGQRSVLLAIASAELSTTHAGHHNIWPLRFDPGARNGGALEWWLGGSLDALYDRSAALGGVVFQLDHGAAYFERADFERATGAAIESDSFTWRFNAMEIQNAQSPRSRARLVPIWYSLLNAGRVVAPLGVSDSHRRAAAPGQARSYVYLGASDADADLPSAEQVASAVLALRTVASTGPLIDLTADDTLRTGDRAPGDSKSPLRLRVAVWAPEWMELARVHLVRDGERVETWNAESTPAVRLEDARTALWFEHEIEVERRPGSWYAVEAEGDRDLAPIYPGVVAWAHTAPIFVERARD